MLPRSRSTDKRFYGIVIAVVTDNNDPEKEGRVKLEFPWFDQEMVSEWCRISQLYAGNGYGSLFVPEVGDEVLVSFVHGDMRIPVVMGGLYNGKDKPSTHHSKEQDQKLIRTKAGHQILFDDTAKKEKIEIITQAGHQFLLDDANGKESITIVSANKKNQIIIDSKDNEINIIADSDISIESSTGKLTLKSKKGIDITSQAAINIKGSTINLN